MSEVVMRPTRKCKLCGRLLFSEKALKKGYGCVCEARARGEPGSADAPESRRGIPGQMSLMDILEG